MAKPRPTPPRKRTAKAKAKTKAEPLSRSIVDSAQQIWLAGIGAFARAQEEGSKLFEALVKEGAQVEESTRKLASDKVDAAREAMGERFEPIRERANDTWERLEKVFEQRVQRALKRLGVPHREEVQALIARVDALNAELRRLSPTPTLRAGARKPASARSLAAKKTATQRTRRSAAATARSESTPPE